MWQSLIRSDLEGIKQSSAVLGVEEMYGLLACILTARSWDVVTTGLDQGPVTDDEVRMEEVLTDSHPQDYRQNQNYGGARLTVATRQRFLLFCCRILPLGDPG